MNEKTLAKLEDKRISTVAVHDLLEQTIGERPTQHVDLTDDGPVFYARVAGVETSAPSADEALRALPSVIAVRARETAKAEAEAKRIADEHAAAHAAAVTAAAKTESDQRAAYIASLQAAEAERAKDAEFLALKAAKDLVAERKLRAELQAMSVDERAELIAAMKDGLDSLADHIERLEKL